MAFSTGSIISSAPCSPLGASSATHCSLVARRAGVNSEFTAILNNPDCFVWSVPPEEFIAKPPIVNGPRTNKTADVRVTLA